jgi:hypothetical protein
MDFGSCWTGEGEACDGTVLVLLLLDILDVDCKKFFLDDISHAKPIVTVNATCPSIDVLFKRCGTHLAVFGRTDNRNQYRQSRWKGRA